MPFTTIENSTTFDAYFNAAQNATAKADILAAMKDAYDRSPIAQNMFDTWVNAGKAISINYTSNNAFVDRATNKLYIDPAFIIDNSYITPTGEAFAETLQTLLLHELGHALTNALGFANLTDADPADPTNTPIDRINYVNITTNYKGENVIFVNTIFKELGIPEQVSYIAYDSEGTLHTAGYQYTNGAAINGAVSVDQAIIDTKNLGTSRDLLIGGALANTLIAGNGSDFLYGNKCDDQLNGGDGSDTYGSSKTDGKDVITDSDGQGQVVIDGKQISGAAKYVNAMTWTLDGYTLTKVGAT
jgi:Ca2+-binding RTX toxin-like protein